MLKQLSELIDTGQPSFYFVSPTCSRDGSPVFGCFWGNKQHSICQVIDDLLGETELSYLSEFVRLLHISY